MGNRNLFTNYYSGGIEGLVGCLTLFFILAFLALVSSCSYGWPFPFKM